MKNKIRTIRENAEITMTALAIRAGISTSSLSLIERQQSCVRSTAEKICEALSEIMETKVTVEEVFEGAKFFR